MRGEHSLGPYQRVPEIAHRGVGIVAQTRNYLIDDRRRLLVVDIECGDAVGGRLDTAAQMRCGVGDFGGIQVQRVDPAEDGQ